MRKIFIGGLPFHCSRDILYSYFAQFGTVLDAAVMVDSETRIPRGFGLSTGATESSVHVTMLSRPHNLLGKTVSPFSSSTKPKNNIFRLKTRLFPNLNRYRTSRYFRSAQFWTWTGVSGVCVRISVISWPISKIQRPSWRAHQDDASESRHISTTTTKNL